MAGSGIGNDRALMRVGHGEDDVVKGGRVVRRDVAGQGRRSCAAGSPSAAAARSPAFSVRPVPIRLGDRLRRTYSRRSISAAAASAMPIVVDDEPGSLGTSSTRYSLKRELSFGRKLEAVGDRVVDPDRFRPSDMASDTSRCAVCREIPSFAAIWSCVFPAT